MYLTSLTTHTVTGWPALVIIVVVLALIVVGVITVVRAVGRKAKNVMDD